MSKEHQENLQGLSGNATDGALNLDDQGIPILEEVVETALPLPNNPEPPDYKELVDSIRDRLERELTDNLQTLAEQTAHEAAVKITQELEPKIKEQLALLLEQQTAKLIEQILDEELGKYQK